MQPSQPETNTPRFEAPQPTGRQLAAMNLVGRLLTAGDPKDPNITLDALVTELGGFELVEKSVTVLGGAAPSFTHKDAESHMVSKLTDETSTGHGSARAPKTSNDFSDSSGTTSRDSAISRSISGQRESGKKAGTVRGKTARRLAQYATKGVGHQPYTKTK